MSRLPSLLLAGTTLLALLIGCAQEQRPVDVSKTERFDERGLSFSYPASWRLSREDTSDDLLMVYVEDAVAAITTVVLLPMPDDAPLDLVDFATTWSAEAAAAMDDLPLGSTGASVFGDVQSLSEPPLWQRLEERFEVTLLGESVPHIRTFVCTGPCNGQVAVLVHQVPDEDAPLVQDGFDLITSSLAVVGGSAR